MHTNTLTEIKKGQTGTGLLIEQDGYVSLDIKNNRQLTESVVNEDGIRELPRPFVVHAVFQKYGIENANGRIYPEDILKREVEKYQQKIKMRNSIGECYTPDVLILTEKDGWKPLGEVKEGENVFTLNTETRKIEIKPIKKKISYEYEGDMVRIQGRSIDDLVTPNHKFPFMKRNHKFDNFYTAEDIYQGGISDLCHSYIPKKGEWDKISSESFVIKGIATPSPATVRTHPDCEDDLVVNTSSFMKFMGIYLSEGDISKNGFAVRIYQVKKDVCELIDNMLAELGLRYNSYTYRGKTTFTIRDPRLHAYLKPLGDCYTKYIPFEIKNQSKENLRLLYDWFVLGDGRKRNYGKHIKEKTLSDDVFSTSKRLVLDLNEIQLKIGYNGVYHVEQRDNDRYINGRLIEGKNTNPLHLSYRSLTNGVYIDKRFVKVTKEYYKGEVDCIEVENHTWFVMSNGHTHWTGNCNHPDDSNINLERTSMLITELHWEGRTLVGQIEIPITEGYRKYGIISCLADHIAHLILNNILIGVSSRALGTVKKVGNVLVVDDSLEILCWDYVSTPSTPNAWISTNYEDLEPFKESEKKDDSKLISEDKYSKFDAWLND